MVVRGGAGVVMAGMVAATGVRTLAGVDFRVVTVRRHRSSGTAARRHSPSSVGSGSVENVSG